MGKKKASDRRSTRLVQESLGSSRANPTREPLDRREHEVLQPAGVSYQPSASVTNNIFNYAAKGAAAGLVIGLCYLAVSVGQDAWATIFQPDSSDYGSALTNTVSTLFKSTGAGTILGGLFGAVTSANNQEVSHSSSVSRPTGPR